ncbi:hypothetical protein [Stenotrophomonas geniculata]
MPNRSPAFWTSPLLAVALAGCSTVPVTDTTAKAVPAERIYEQSYLLPSPDRTATIFVARDKGMLGSGCSHDISLNNVKIMSLRQSEAATLHVVPGSYFLKLSTGGGLCANISTSQNLTLSAGERQSYRVTTPSDFNLRLTREE